MAKIPAGIKLLIDNTSFQKMDTWGLSADISERMNKLADESESLNIKDKKRVFKQAIIQAIIDQGLE